MTSAISVKDRLKNLAIANGKTMQENLTAYGLEITVYRLSISEYAGRFTLKGGRISDKKSGRHFPLCSFRWRIYKSNQRYRFTCGKYSE